VGKLIRRARAVRARELDVELDPARRGDVEHEACAVEVLAAYVSTRKGTQDVYSLSLDPSTSTSVTTSACLGRVPESARRAVDHRLGRRLSHRRRTRPC
jgi:hypothetical protein